MVSFELHGPSLALAVTGTRQCVDGIKAPVDRAAILSTPLSAPVTVINDVVRLLTSAGVTCSNRSNTKRVCSATYGAPGTGERYR